MNTEEIVASIDRYRRLATRFTAVVDAVPGDRWSAPSPCSEWNAIDVVRHVVETEHDLYSRMGFAGLPEISAEDPIGSWPAVRDAMQSALDTPAMCTHAYDGYFGPTTFVETIDTFYSMDLLVHSWDLARAAGLTDLEQLDPGDMHHAQQAMAGYSEMSRMPGIFGPATTVAPDATDQDRFLAWTGRTP